MNGSVRENSLFVLFSLFYASQKIPFSKKIDKNLIKLVAFLSKILVYFVQFRSGRETPPTSPILNHSNLELH